MTGPIANQGDLESELDVRRHGSSGQLDALPVPITAGIPHPPARGGAESATGGGLLIGQRDSTRSGLHFSLQSADASPPRATPAEPPSPHAAVSESPKGSFFSEGGLARLRNNSLSRIRGASTGSLSLGGSAPEGDPLDQSYHGGEIVGSPPLTSVMPPRPMPRVSSLTRLTEWAKSRSPTAASSGLSCSSSSPSQGGSIATRMSRSLSASMINIRNVASSPTDGLAGLAYRCRGASSDGPEADSGWLMGDSAGADIIDEEEEEVGARSSSNALRSPASPNNSERSLGVERAMERERERAVQARNRVGSAPW